MNRYRMISLIFILILASCGARKTSTEVSSISSLTTNVISPGDIIVAGVTSDDIYLLDSNGVLKTVLYDTNSTIHNVYGIAWKADSQELLASLDGTSDAIITFSTKTGERKTFHLGPDLNGTIRGITQLQGGDVLVAESNTLERFTTDGTRVVSGWPKVNIQSILEQVNPLSDGGFVLCSRGTDVVRTYDNDGNQIASITSGITGTTDCYGAIELDNGNIATTWSGITDTVIIFDSSLSKVVASYSDTSKLGAPRGITQKANGNLLIADGNFNHLVELDGLGNFIGILGSKLGSPQHILVIPSF